MSEKRRDSNGRILKTGENQRANGTYQFRYKNIRKETKCVYAPTLQELREKEDQIWRDLKDGIDTSKGGKTLGEALDEYLSIKLARVRKATAQTYESMARRIKRYDICEMRVDKISKTTAKKWVIQLKNDGFSYRTINTTKIMVGAALNLCIDDDIIRKNPMDFNLSTVIEDEIKEKIALTPREYENVLSFIKRSNVWSRYYNMIVVMAETGVRVSELCGLTIGDVDFKNKTLSITKQLRRTQHGLLYIEKPKTASGTRIIPLTENAFNALQSAIEKRKKTKTEVVVDGVYNFIFLAMNGSPRTAVIVSGIFRRIVEAYKKKTGKDIIMTPHTLRHTFCSKYAETGIPVKDLQYLMGHADVTTTMNIYSHTNLDSVKEHFYKAAASQ